MEEGRLEEERRLCYVGITRAKQILYISYAQSRRLHGKETIQRPSRFIAELPPESITEIRSTSTPSRNRPTGKQPTKSQSGPSQTTAQPADDGGEYRAGRKVFHRQFGLGTIIDGSAASDGRIQINFKSIFWLY